MKYTKHQKIIPYQTIITLRKKLEALNAWEPALHQHLAYFDQKIAPGQSDYLVQRTIAHEFIHDYLSTLKDVQKEVESMKHAPAIKPRPFLTD